MRLTWLRSALKVAALNCLDPEHADILPAYKAYLERGEKELTQTNRAVLAEYRENYGSEGQAAYDRFMTQVYNYFALPPALADFCDASQVVARESLLVPAEEFDAFALRSLPVLEAVFDGFYSSYERYRTSLASWNAEYGPPQPATTLVATNVTAGLGGQGLPATDLPASGEAFAGTDVSSGETVQAIPTFDPSPSVASPPAAGQAIVLPTFEQPVQMVSEPVVQGQAQASAEPGFGASVAPPAPVEEQPAETPVIVLTPVPEPEPAGSDDAENGGE